ncbi:MAG: hypothetical protein ACLQPH_07515 [Acidimicrobiales bacterium]
MSVYLDELLAPNNLERRNVIDGHEGFYVAALSVGDLTDEEQQVQPDPITPPEHPCDPAHAQVIGQKGRKRRKRVASVARWVAGLGPGSGPYLDPGGSST